MICVTGGGTFGKGNVCVLMVAILDSAYAFRLIISVFSIH